MCAETTAVGNAISGGDRDLIAIAVSTDLPPEHPKSLCGRCRQFIAEFADPSVPVIIFSDDNSSTYQTVGEILPNAFTPKALKRVHLNGSAPS